MRSPRVFPPKAAGAGRRPSPLLRTASERHVQRSPGRGPGRSPAGSPPRDNPTWSGAITKQSFLQTGKGGQVLAPASRTRPASRDNPLITVPGCVSEPTSQTISSSCNTAHAAASRGPPAREWGGLEHRGQLTRLLWLSGRSPCLSRAEKACTSPDRASGPPGASRRRPCSWIPSQNSSSSPRKGRPRS